MKRYGIREVIKASFLHPHTLQDIDNRAEALRILERNKGKVAFPEY